MKRKLTISFSRAVGSVTRSPAEIEVVLMAVGSQSSSHTDTTYLPAPDRRVIQMNKPVVTVEFDVTPSDDPSFEEPLVYRIAWRRGYIGKMESHDFLMPNKDVTFEDLLRLDQMDPDRDLTEADLGVPGRVAQLSSDGLVMGSDGIPLYTPAQIDTFFAESDALRQREDQGILAHLDSSMSSLQTAMDNSVRSQIANSEQRTEQSITLTREALEEADRLLRADLTALIEGGGNEVPENLIELLNAKADLVDGKIKSEQLPEDFAQGELHKITHNDRLVTTQASKGDIAVSPTDAWFLTGDYSVQSDWVRLSTLLPGVQSVNGKSGSSVYISAADVGARPAGNIPVSDITGLSQRLSEEMDGVIREDADGKLDTAYLRADVPRLDGTRLLNAAGEEIPLRGDVTSVNTQTGDVIITPESIGARKAGESIPISDVTNLQSNLNLKVNVSDPRLTDSRTPTAHADSHKADGGDPLLIEQSQVVNLTTDLADRATKAEFQAFKDAIYADLPENPEQQANAAGEYAALSLTGAENSADKLEQMTIYLNETNTKYSLFEENATGLNSKYVEVVSAKNVVDQAVVDINDKSTQITQDRNQVMTLRQEVGQDRAQAEEAAALALLVAELFDFGTELDYGGIDLEALRGEPGRTPVFEWDGTRLVIDGVPGPDLKGEPGGGTGGGTVTLVEDPDNPGLYFIQ